MIKTDYNYHVIVTQLPVLLVQRNLCFVMITRNLFCWRFHKIVFSLESNANWISEICENMNYYNFSLSLKIMDSENQIFTLRHQNNRFRIKRNELLFFKFVRKCIDEVDKQHQ